MKTARFISIVAAFGLGLMTSIAMASNAPVQQVGESQPIEMRGNHGKHKGWAKGNNGRHYGWVRGKHKGWGKVKNHRS